MHKTSLIIGLTGNIATGKSTILKYMAAKGAHIIDADELSHRAIEPGGAAYQAVVNRFGKRILADDGTINRRELGRIVFADAAQLGWLEQVVHPAVFELAFQEINQTSANLIVLEAVKLLEAGALVTLCDEVWVVTAKPEIQLRRLTEERGMTAAEARQRMQMQSPQAAKVNQADRVIRNDGEVEGLYARLDEIWADLLRMYPERLASRAME